MNKFNYIKVIQQYFSGHGWEDVSEYNKPTTRGERQLIRHDMKEYRLSGPYPVRLISRRTLNTVK